jgi:hypothetical protein
MIKQINRENRLERERERERERPCNISNVGDQCKNEHERIQALKDYKSKRVLSYWNNIHCKILKIQSKSKKAQRASPLHSLS